MTSILRLHAQVGLEQSDQPDPPEHREEREQLMQRADRMAMLGMLSASIAHEVGNPLTYLLGNLELMRAMLQKGTFDQAQFLEHLDEAATGATRIAHIVRDMRAMSRRDDPQTLREIELSEPVQGAIEMARGEIRMRAQLEIELGPTPPVVASPLRLRQVVLHLLVNAAQAIPFGRPGDTVRVVTGTGKDGEAFIAVSDTGIGIAPEHRDKLFTPFFTTKPDGEGTGLGLTICSQLVAQYGGRIEVESEPGRGSTFRVVLPPPVRVTPPKA